MYFNVAKDFIRHLIVVDQSQRTTVKMALQHPWMVDNTDIPKNDLLPKCKKGFNAKKVFRRAIDVVKAVNKLSSHRSSTGRQSPSPLPHSSMGSLFENVK
jgi:calcium/calmodulin-dependent protein kinase I